MSYATVIHHANCPDGALAAWLICDRLDDEAWDDDPRHAADITIVPANYGDPPPLDACQGADVFIVDFCYPPLDLKAISDVADQLTVLDHHQTAGEWMAAAVDEYGADDLPQHVVGVGVPDDRGRPWWYRTRDVMVSITDQSGAGLAATWTGYRPQLVDFVEDRDLWRFRFEHTRAVMAAVLAHPLTVDGIGPLTSSSRITDLVRDGTAINLYRDQLIDQAVAQAWQMTVLGHDDIWVANCSYSIGSDVADLLGQRDPERFAGYYFDQPGQRQKWGLRSQPDGLDVAALAALVGGGGHRHAAGFTLDLTPGDDQ